MIRSVCGNVSLAKCTFSHAQSDISAILFLELKWASCWYARNVAEHCVGLISSLSDVLTRWAAHSSRVSHSQYSNTGAIDNLYAWVLRCLIWFYVYINSLVNVFISLEKYESQSSFGWFGESGKGCRPSKIWLCGKFSGGYILYYPKS